MEHLVVARIPVGMTLGPRCDRWDPANSAWIAGCKARSQSGLPVNPRRRRWDPTCIGKIPPSPPGIPDVIGLVFCLNPGCLLPSDNIFENPMQSSVRNHDAFSNNKTWKEIQICHAKFVLSIITNMFNVNVVSRHHDWNHYPRRIPMNKLKLSGTEKQKTWGVCVENIQSASKIHHFIICRLKAKLKYEYNKN